MIDNNARAGIIVTTIFVSFFVISYAFLIGDLRTRTGHLETTNKEQAALIQKLERPSKAVTCTIAHNQYYLIRCN